MRGGEQGAVRCSGSHAIGKMLAMHVQGHLRGGVKGGSHMSPAGVRLCACSSLPMLPFPLPGLLEVCDEPETHKLRHRSVTSVRP